MGKRKTNITTPSPAQKRRQVTPQVAATPVSLAQAAEVAEELIKRRTTKSTKKTYQSRIRQAIEWFSVHRPECLNAERTALVIPIEKKPLLEFFGHLCAPAYRRERMAAEDIDPKDPEPLQFSTVDGYKSAILDLYRSENKFMDAQTKQSLQGTLDGYAQTLNLLRKNAKMSISVGRRPFLISGYYMLAEKFMTVKPSGSGSWGTTVFGWAFLLIMWNLMSRSDSVDALMVQHVEWQGDALVIEEQGSKTDKTGENKYWKHLYANPFDPCVCPVLALAVLIFCCDYRPERGRQQLFSGTDSKGRFSRLLQEVIDNLTEEEIRLLGCSAADIGTHSSRKGVGTYCLGQVAGPSSTAVALRMGHSIGPVRDVYIFPSDGADQLCGRMASGLPFNDIKFGVLPPHFVPQVTDQLTDEYWRTIVPGYENYPDPFKSVSPFLLASLIYHEEFLRQKLPSDHPLWTARVFTHNQLLGTLRLNKPVLAYGASPVTGLKATGVPPHLAIADTVAKLTKAIENLRSRIDDMEMKFREYMPADVAAKVCEELRAGFVIDGVMPVNLRDIDVRLNSLKADMSAMLHEALARYAAAATAQAPPMAEPDTRAWRQFDWGDGCLTHYVPKGWRFPHGITAKAMWDLWFFGDKSTGIRPYRALSKCADVQQEDHMMHRRAKLTMEYLQKKVEESDAMPPGKRYVAQLTIVESDRLFDAQLMALLASLYSPDTMARKEEIKFSTLYNLIVAADVNGDIVRKRKRTAKV